MDLVYGENGLEVVHANSDNWTLNKELGLQPLDMFATSVAACETMGFNRQLTDAQIEHTIQKVTVEYTRSDLQPARPIKEITITFYVAVPDKAQHVKTVELTEIAQQRCPAAQSLASDIVVKENVVFEGDGGVVLNKERKCVDGTCCI
jgi:uncharacterized OsmC-like protein